MSSAVSPRTRVALVVAAAAATAAAAAVGIAVLQSDGAATPNAGDRRLRGAPPLVLDLGVRTDPEARALRRASALYERGRRGEAAEIFRRYRSAQARIGAAVADWPQGTIARLQALERSHRRSALVRLNLGIALLASGQEQRAKAEWRAAAQVEPDTAAAVRAMDFLHPGFPRGLPSFVPSFDVPARIERLAPHVQLVTLERLARTGGVRDKLLYGVFLQRLERPLSARRQFAAAAALAPAEVEPRVAVAVASFSKAAPARAFGRLGPLTRRHPRSQTVRFHLGLLLLWINEPATAQRQLRLARAAAPATKLGRQADRFLQRLSGIGGG